MSNFNEATVEDAALDYFREAGYATAWGPHLAPGEPGQERESFQDVILEGRLRASILRINAELDATLVEEAIKKLRRAESQNPIDENFRLHKLISQGIPLEHRGPDGQIRTTRVRIVDFERAEDNDWLAVNQFTIIEEGRNRRPDVIVFLNGLPVGLLELKNSADQNATLKNAWNQIQTYRTDVPSLFILNAITVLSDGVSSSMSSYTGAYEHYAPWKTIEGREVITDRPSLEVLIKGVFEPKRFLDILQNFIVFSDETATDKLTGQPTRVLVKRVAKYHQYWAVNAAIDSTVDASSPGGDRRGGVVWHTQGSGKSF
jgi:type I restriction enzyme R subunit